MLKAARERRLGSLFVVTLLLGLRRGEALGLRWEDVDLEAGVVRIRQTLQRVGGELRYAPPKTARSRRTVPLPPIVTAAFTARQLEQEAERSAADAWADNGLVFTTKLGTPIEPRNFSRDFKAFCVRAGSPEQ
jgi:integrase